MSSFVISKYLLENQEKLPKVNDRFLISFLKWCIDEKYLGQ